MSRRAYRVTAHGCKIKHSGTISTPGAAQALVSNRTVRRKLERAQKAGRSAGVKS